MIKNIVFDMGNVLIRFDPELFLNRYLLLPEDRELLKNEIFRSVEWVKLDRGDIDEMGAKEEMLKRIPERLHSIAIDLVDTWDRPVIQIEGMYELLGALKHKGYRLYLLSNASRRHHDYWPKVPASKLFDGKLISADVNLLKPELKIYRTLLDEFKLNPSECVFIDDMPANVEGALRAGMSGIVFNMSAEELKNRLRKLGVNV